MITDGQIADTFHKHGCYIDEDMSAMSAVCELIALAQQVKPLEFVKTGDYDNSTPPVEHYSATTEFGIIELIVDGDRFIKGDNAARHNTSKTTLRNDHEHGNNKLYRARMPRSQQSVL